MKNKFWFNALLALLLGAAVSVGIVFGAGYVQSVRAAKSSFDITDNGYAGRPDGERLEAIQSDPRLAETADRMARSVVAIVIEVSEKDTAYAIGSGVFVGEDKDYLYLYTNDHVVSDGDAWYLYYDDVDPIYMELLGKSAKEDAALCRVKKSDFPAELLENIVVAEIGDSDTLRRGDTVIVIGTPSQLQFFRSVTVGVVADTDVYIEVSNIKRHYFQTDAVINFGNSGGGVFDINGKLIGISGARSTDYGSDAQCFALQMNRFAKCLEEFWP